MLLNRKTTVLCGTITVAAASALGSVIAVGMNRTSNGSMRTEGVEAQAERELQGFVTRVTGRIVQEESSREYPWKANSVRQAVYEAVLEGLYRDHVSDAIVSNIIGEKSQNQSSEMLQARMKRSFVLNCPLCEPTFEAFLTYQMRNKQGEGETTRKAKRGAGDGIEQKLQKRLLGKRAGERTRALGRVTEKWISVKLNSKHQFKSAEIQAWKDSISKRASEGQSELFQLIESSEHYKEWSPYTGCGVCNGAKLAAEGWE